MLTLSLQDRMVQSLIHIPEGPYSYTVVVERLFVYNIMVYIIHASLMRLWIGMNIIIIFIPSYDRSIDLLHISIIGAQDSLIFVMRGEYDPVAV